MALGAVYGVQLEEQKQKILGAVTVNGKTADEIAKDTDMRPGTVRTVLSDLVKENRVVRKGEGKRDKPFVFSLPAGRQVP